MCSYFILTLVKNFSFIACYQLKLQFQTYKNTKTNMFYNFSRPLKGYYNNNKNKNFKFFCLLYGVLKNYINLSNLFTIT